MTTITETVTNEIENQMHRDLVAVCLTSKVGLEDIVEAIPHSGPISTQYKAIYDAILSLHAKGKHIDANLVASTMKARDLDAIGGLDTLQVIAAGASDVAYRDYIKVTQESFSKQSLISGLEQALSAARNTDGDFADVASTVEAIYTNGLESGAAAQPGLTDIKTALKATFEALRTPDTGRGVEWFIPEMNFAMDANGEAIVRTDAEGNSSKVPGHEGLKKGNMYLVAARPAMGKSAFLLQQVYYTAKVEGKASILVSYEMSSVEMTYRLLSQVTSIPLSRLTQSPEELTEEQWEVLEAAQAELEDLPIYLEGGDMGNDLPTTVTALKRQVARLVRAAKSDDTVPEIGCVGVDYLQLMYADGKTNSEQEEVSSISKALKNMAMILEVPVVALAQLNRSAEGVTPSLIHLRSSGSLEQDANAVFFIVRENVTNPSAPADEAKIVLRKNRSGVSGVEITMEFDGPRVTFKSVPGNNWDEIVEIIPTQEGTENGSANPGTYASTPAI